MRSIARAPHYRRAERLLRRRSGGVARLPASGLTPCSMSSPLGLSEIGRSPFRKSDDYAFHCSGATLLRAERLLRRRSGGMARIPCRQRHPG